MTAAAITRLGSIVLPDFKRVAWVSSEAARIWGPAFRAVETCWSQLVLRLAEAGPAPVVAVAARADTSHRLRALAVRNGLVVKPVPAALHESRLLPWTAPTIVPSRTPRTRLLVGRRDRVEALTVALRDDGGRAKELLGIPRCCQEFHQTELTAWADPWWPLSEHTVRRGGGHVAHAITLPEECSRVLLRAALGLPTIWYVPCSLLCPHALEHERLVAAALSGDALAPDAKMFDQVGVWPVLWSGLHGIAEIKTPVLRLIQPTDPTAENLRVRLAGESGIEAAAHGVRFPYR